MARRLRDITTDDKAKNTPVYAVWETTMMCNHACAHCGSRAGPEEAREKELTTKELLEVADKLAAMGTREVTLIGGEAYLRDDICTLVSHLHQDGIRVTMQTGGRGLSPKLCEKLAAAGMAAIGVSIDGPARIHDVLRASPGSHIWALRALQNAREAGMLTTSNIQINRLNKDHIRETRDLIREAGVRVWRAQMTVPMGRAADRPEWILQPWEIMDVVNTLGELQIEEAQRTKDAGLPPQATFDILASNNIGYFGPYEEILRSRPGGTSRYWTGCGAGRFTMGIESDGTVKACPSLPTSPYTGGNLLEIPLEEIWDNAPEIHFTRDRTTDELWGFCKGCYYADVCKAGCSFTAHCTLGKRGNNPFCYHRASTLKKEGLRERLVQKQSAEGDPYDFGLFELELEDWVD